MLEYLFAILERRLDKLETLLIEVKEGQSIFPCNAPEAGGIELAQEITRLSKPRLYALVSAPSIPHTKRRNKRCAISTGPSGGLG